MKQNKKKDIPTRKRVGDGINMKNYSQIKEYFLSKKHRSLRRELTVDLASEYSKKHLPCEERVVSRFEFVCAQEIPMVFEGEKIAFLRTVKNLPSIYTDEELAQIKSEHFIHELGFMSNVTPDYAKILSKGLIALKDGASESTCREIDAVIDLAKRYRDEALKVGNTFVANTLKQVPEYPARNFAEALQFFRIIHYSLWLEGVYHVTVGCFDRYMYPYFEKDIKEGVLTEDEAYQLLEEFFLSFNKDSDLYPGVQQGDNGQSMVLGGTDENGEYYFNKLSELCLKASGELLLIDPKINIRVSKDTPIEVYQLGTELTAKGLGFPQYTNDDIVLPALEKLGYDKKDAVNYTMAACWEVIIPGVGTDIANIGALSFVKVIDECLHKDLPNCKDMDEFMLAVKNEINKEIDKITENIKDLVFFNSPLLDCYMTSPVSKNGGKYNNFGLHGTGITNAADSLVAINKYLFEDKCITASQLIDAVDKDFIGYSELLHKLRFETPKVGQNDDVADEYLVALLNAFSNSLEGRINCRGGKYRAGTGSAMYYLWHANEIGASPDGRRKGEPLGANFSTSLFALTGGPFSVIESLTKPDFTKAMNGGPVTLEFSADMWKGEGTKDKFASFIKTYIAMGGHQIQLNSVNLQTLKDAKIHPENYERLVVRIWGWSAYFVELDEEFQNHVMARQEYSV